ncbi:MAG: sigma-70 factor domain-containing protein [Faecalibacterium prausnitzii]
MDELLDDPVKNYLKQIGQIPLLSAEQEVDLSKRIHAGAEAAHILQADRQKYGAPEYIKKNSARFSFEEDENSRSYTEDIDEEGSEKPSVDAEEKAAEEEAMEAVENGP